MNTSFIRAYLAWGLKPWHNLAFFQARDEYLTRRSWYESLGILPRQNLSVCDKAETWIEQLVNWQPHLLQGYALTMKLLADAVRTRGAHIHIPLIVNTSGMLDDHGRKMLRSAFDAKVIDIYASEEAGSAIAWECPSCSDYHINADTVIVELLRDGLPVRPGEEGEIVITNLHNYTMPFIRYRQEDIGILSEKEPSCKRGLPLLREIRGRTGDYVILPSGTKLTPHPFFMILDDIVGIGEWRLIQEDIDQILVEITPTDAFDEKIADVIAEKLDSIVGGTINIRISLVEQIRRDPFQKLRSVVSEVAETDDKFVDSDTTRKLRLFGKTYDELLSTSLVRTIPEIEEVKDILEKAKHEDLPLKEINQLINGIYSSQFRDIRDYLLDLSSGIRKDVFGDAVVPMAPVEASNICASNCMFCGWRSSNSEMERSGISEYLIMEQVKYLLRKGIYYIEFVGGDDFNFVRRTLPSLIRSTRILCHEMRVKPKICFCTMALTRSQYRELKELGADSMIVWQETYDPTCFKRLIIGGPKAKGIDEDWSVVKNGDGYSFRLHSQERALEAGLEVALGTMLGLNDNLNFEILATIEHARYLIETYGITNESPLIIGMPIWNAITTRSTDIRPISKGRINPYFSYVAAIYFLSLPKGRAWIFPNCRVGIDDQIESVAAAGVLTSTEVKVGPGGYLPEILAEKKRAGEDTKEIEHRIASEFGSQHSDLTSLRRLLERKEQFVHFHYLHEVYLERMRDVGLRVLQSATLEPS
jgi:2-iminoacetate synthase ThiH